MLKQFLLGCMLLMCGCVNCNEDPLPYHTYPDAVNYDFGYPNDAESVDTSTLTYEQQCWQTCKSQCSSGHMYCDYCYLANGCELDAGNPD